MKALIVVAFSFVLGAGLFALAPVSQDGGGERGEGGSGEQDKTGDPVVDRLLDETTWQEAADQILEERRKRIEAILLIATREIMPRMNMSKYRAIELLGQLGAPEACEPLIRELDLLNHPLSDGFGTASFYPVAAALVEIGMPAVRELYAYLRMGEEEEGEIPDDRMRLAAWVLEHEGRA